VNTVILAVIASGAAAVVTLALLLVVASAAVNAWSARRGDEPPTDAVDGRRPSSGPHEMVARVDGPDGRTREVLVLCDHPLAPGTVLTVSGMAAEAGSAPSVGPAR
jgi:hypothetical protein